MTIKESLREGIEKLNQNEISDSIIKVRLLLTFVLKKSKEYLIINEEYELSFEEQEMFRKAINRLVQGEPIQYITGKQEFMGMDFIVNKNVLIPRPDTEILVEESIEILKAMQRHAIVLDMCTGSGAIAISIAKYIENVKIVGVDISEEALEVAKHNSTNNEISIDKIQFIQSDLFNNLEEKFDMIVSNPPYIGKEALENLETEVKKEPILALAGGEDGIDFYRNIISKAYKHLKPEGYLCLEIGYNQREDVMQLIENCGKYTNIYAKKDLAGNDRIIICKLYM